uniref:PCNA_C domain-containing protein n=1 Tax=Strongyloides venezuelensis TaxID=75913 RepID=A0A0K0FAU2_STRVS
MVVSMPIRYDFPIRLPSSALKVKVSPTGISFYQIESKDATDNIMKDKFDDDVTPKEHGFCYESCTGERSRK